MPTTLIIPRSLTRGTPSRQIYYRSRWDYDWTLADQGLDVDWMEFAASPAISQAVLFWRYGAGMQPGQGSYRSVQRVVREDFFVKIVTDPDYNIPVWYGRVIEIYDNRGGAIINKPLIPFLQAETRIPQGIESIVCWGLESDLERVTLTQSRLLGPEGAEAEINRALAFNLGAGGHRDFNRGRLGNRSVGTGQKGTYCFGRTAADLQIAEEWTAHNALEYLLAYYRPRDSNNNTAVPWSLDPAADASYLESLKPVLQYDDKTLRWTIDALTDRRRGAGWQVRVDETFTPARVYVSVFSQLDTDIVFADGGRIKANADQVNIDVDTSPEVKVQFRTSMQNRYDQVIVRGARQGSVCTLSFADGTLDIDWAAADATAYNAAASGAGDYAGLSKAKKQERNDNYRTALQFNRAYTYFKLVDNGLLQKNGIGVGDAQPIFPVIDDQGNASATDSVKYFHPGLRIERHLPLLTNHNYSDDKLQINAVVDTTPAGGRAERLPMMVLIKLESDSSGTTRYAPVDRLSAAPTDQAVAPRRYSYSVRPQEDFPGLVLTCGPKKLQHMFAKTDFVKADDTDNDILPELDYKDNLLATVYMLSDEHLEERHPSDADLALAEPREDFFGNPIRYDLCRRLIIDAPHMRLDWVVPQTVVATKDGVLVRTLGGWLRDDRPNAKRLCELASAWYLQDRQAVEMVIKYLRGLPNVGQLIVAMGAAETLEAVCTVITRVRFDFLSGTTTISTSHAELDLTAGSPNEF